MSGKFLGSTELGAAISHVMAGRDIRCAVAFWGTGASAHLFPSGGLRDAKIICDLALGGTNPGELHIMGAPSNKTLRHIERFHAKVYISDRGAVVGSANASDNGIGFGGTAALVEAGVLVEAASPSFAAVEDWFGRLWERSRMVGQAELAAAEATWNARPRGPRMTARPVSSGAPSLLNFVAANPEAFRGIGFAFTTGAADGKDLQAASRELARRDDERQAALLSREERKKISTWRIDDLFTGWSKADVRAWPGEFVCIHRPGTRAHYSYYRRVHDVLLGEDRGVVFGERPKGLRAELGFVHGSAAMLATDAPLLDRIFGHCEHMGQRHWLCENGESLARLIGEVERA